MGTRATGNSGDAVATVLHKCRTAYRLDECTPSHCYLHSLGTTRYNANVNYCLPRMLALSTIYGVGYPFHNHSIAVGRVWATVGRSTCLELRANTNW